MPPVLPPATLVTWSATALGDDWLGYNVYSRPSFGPLWIPRARIRPVARRSRAEVEATHVKWVDEEVGWTTDEGPYPDGHDYVVTYLHRNGTEPVLEAAATGQEVAPPAHGVWLCRNADRWLNVGLDGVEEQDVTIDAITQAYRLVGRDHSVTRTRPERPSRTASFTAGWLNDAGADSTRMLQAVARAGLPMSMLRVTGDRLVGVPRVQQARVTAGVGASAEVSVLETQLEPDVSDCNWPASLVLDGSNDYAAVPDTSAAMDPGTGAFSIFVCGSFAAAPTYLLTKGNVGSADGWAIHKQSASEVRFLVDGATTAFAASYLGTEWTDGHPHVFVGVYDGAGTLRIYFDGRLVGTQAGTPGTVSNAVAAVAGANNGGASGHGAMDLMGFGYYGRALDATEAERLSYYMLGSHAYRRPGRAAVFVDFRDRRCFSPGGTYATDLAAGILVTVSGSPRSRGFPWPLDLLEAAA